MAKERRPPVTGRVELDDLRRRLSEARSRVHAVPGPAAAMLQTLAEQTEALEEVAALELQLEDSLALADRRRYRRELATTLVSTAISLSAAVAAAFSAWGSNRSALVIARRYEEGQKAVISYFVSRADLRLGGTTAGEAFGAATPEALPPVPGQPQAPKGTRRTDPWDEFKRAGPKAAAQGSRVGEVELHILARNLSERPGAIVDLDLEDSAGQKVSFNRQVYLERLDVPITIPSWGARRIDFRLDPKEADRAANLVLIDMDGARCSVPVRPLQGWTGWHCGTARSGTR